MSHHRSCPWGFSIARHLAALAMGAATVLAGCQAAPAPATPSTVSVRTQLRITSPGETGDLEWEDLVNRSLAADVIVLGEEHDDATGHAVQLAVVEDVLKRRAGGTVALEMLERDEQILIDDYVDGIIDAEAFAKATSSTNWAGTGSWTAWYQPIIDATIARDGRIVAANAPRRYVRLARRDGWEALAALPKNRATLATVPPESIDGVYRERFFEIMSPDDHEGVETDTTIIESFFDAQQVWDATMAESVAEAIRAHGPPVILLVGRFHSDHHGGTIRELERRLPDHSILAVSLETGRGEPLEAGQDVPQADIIVFTRPVTP
ncbi:MAG: ChaN family lipoprotein [Phycisphaerales bacterium]|nr:ChaN family lipoprotein [Phycisphaerales bacterium]